MKSKHSIWLKTRTVLRLWKPRWDWIFFQYGGSEETRSHNTTRLYSCVQQCSYKLTQSMFWHYWSLVFSDFQNNLLSASRFICILWATDITGSYSQTLYELNVADVSSKEMRDVLFLINALLYYHTALLQGTSFWQCVEYSNSEWIYISKFHFHWSHRRSLLLGILGFWVVILHFWVSRSWYFEECIHKTGILYYNIVQTSKLATLFLVCSFPHTAISYFSACG